MCRSTMVASLDEGSVDDLALGSSPTTATTPPLRCGAGEHGVPDGVAGAVDAGALAVPDAEDAVVPAVVERGGQLAPHHRGGGELLVDAALVDHRQIGHRAQRPFDLFVEHADRRALVAAQEGGGVEPVAAIDPQLIDREPCDCLHAGQEDPALLEAIPVGDLVVGLGALPGSVGHPVSLPQPPGRVRTLVRLRSPAVNAAVPPAIWDDGTVLVVVGEALVDLVIDPTGKVVAALGGAPFNTARACGRLGAEVAFLGVISVDRFGSMLQAELESAGVSTASAPRCELPTTLAAAELDEHGSATYRFYFEGTSAPSLTARSLVEGACRAPLLFTGGLALVLEPMAVDRRDDGARCCGRRPRRDDRRQLSAAHRAGSSVRTSHAWSG